MVQNPYLWTKAHPAVLSGNSRDLRNMGGYTVVLSKGKKGDAVRSVHEAKDYLKEGNVRGAEQLRKSGSFADVLASIRK